MYILESFDKELYERDLKEDAYEEGKAAGLRASVDNIMKNLKVSAERACEIAGVSLEVYKETLESAE